MNKTQQFVAGLTSMERHKYVPFLGGFVDMERAMHRYKLAMKNPDLRTNAENQTILLQAINEQIEKKSKDFNIPYNAGKMTGHSLPFMGEIIMTGPIYRGVRAGLNRGIKTSIYAGINKGVRTMAGFQKGGGSLRFSKTGKMLFVPKFQFIAVAEVFKTCDPSS